MSTLPAPCLSCGNLAQLAHGYCPSCTRPGHPDRRRGRDRDKTGRGWQWDQISRRARRLQPWCSDCGTSQDLTTDHTPQAWAAILEGRPVTLRMVDVCCRSCNSKRGPAIPGSERWEAWQVSSSGHSATARFPAPGGIPSQQGSQRPRRFSPEIITHSADERFSRGHAA